MSRQGGYTPHTGAEPPWGFALSQLRIIFKVDVDIACLLFWSLCYFGDKTKDNSVIQLLITNSPLILNH